MLDLPGYDHLDVITAAPRQSDGSRERAALATTDFVLAEAGQAGGPTPTVSTGGASDAQIAAGLAKLGGR